MSTTIYEATMTEDDDILHKCNEAAYYNDVKSGFFIFFRCRFIVEFAFLTPSNSNSNNNNDDDNDNHYRREWDTCCDTGYVSDSSISSYESVKLLVSNFFTLIGMPEDEQIRIINSMRAFFRIHRHEREGLVPMVLDLGIVTVLSDEEAARIWMMRNSMSVDKIKTLLATEWSIMGLKKLKVLNGGECCAVCLDELLLGTEVLGMPCNHVFHGDCITRWFRTMHVCPLCRHAMRFGKNSGT